MQERLNAAFEETFGLVVHLSPFIDGLKAGEYKMRKSLPFFAIIALITATLMANCVLEFPNADIYPEGYRKLPSM